LFRQTDLRAAPVRDELEIFFEHFGV
jgi:hypothetical protein